MLQAKGLAHKVLNILPIEIIIEKNHRLFHADTIPVNELEHELFIDSVNRSFSQSYYLKGVISIPPENVVAIHHNDIRHQLLSQGVGYMLSRRLSDATCEQYGLRCTPLKDLYTEIICITNPTRPLNDMGKQFLTYLDEEIAK